MSLLQLFELQDTANTIAEAHNGGKYKFRITHSDKGFACSRNGNDVSICIPDLKKPLSEEDVSACRGHVYRSVLRYTDGSDKLIYDKKKVDPNKGAVFNMIEAARLEHLGANRYIGDKQDFSGEVVRSASKQREFQRGKIDDNEAKLLAVNAASLNSRKDFSVDAYQAAAKALDEMPPSVKAHYEKIKDAGLLDFSQDATAGSTDERVEKVHKLLWDEDTTEEKQKGEKGEPEEGDGEGEGEGEGEEGEGDKETKAKNMAEALSGVPQDDKSPPPTDKKGRPGGIGAASDATALLTPKEFIVRHHVSRKKVVGVIDKPTVGAIDPMRLPWFTPTSSRSYGSYRRHVNYEKATGLAKQLQRYLMVKSEEQWVGGELAGRINRRDIFRMLMPAVGDGEWNSRVFKKQHKNDVLDVAISVAVDCSGSMCHGSKVGGAVSAVALLNEVFAKALRVPIEIFMFTDHQQPVHHIVKEFDERVNTEDLIDRAIVAYDDAANNADPEALMDAYFQVLKRKEKRKGIIVVSDGAPACGAHRYSTGVTRSGVTYGHRGTMNQITQMVEADKRVSLHAIGLCSDEVKHYYKNYRICNTPSELPEALLSTFKVVANFI